MGVRSKFWCNPECSRHGADEPRRHVLKQPVEALGSVNLVVSLGYIGSIADLKEMACAFAEISARDGHYFGHAEAATSHGDLGFPTES